ncbi:hypothetical protein B0J14DRAFT_473449, partial [Halenospora varia]
MVCGVEFVPKVVSAYDAFSVGTAVTGTSAVAVGSISLKSLIANMLKDKTEKGVAYPLKVDIPHSDLIQATVTAIPDAAITYTLTKIAGVIATQTSSTASQCWRYIGSEQTPVPNDDDYETDADDETVDDPVMARSIAGRVALLNTSGKPAAVDYRINILKGRLLTPGFEIADIPLTGSGTAYRNINLLNDILSFDKIQKCVDPTNTFSWAREYKAWIPKYLKARQAEIAVRTSAIGIAIVASGDLEKAGKKTLDGEAWESLGRIYGDKFWEWPLDRLLNFSEASTSILTPGSFDITRR